MSMTDAGPDAPPSVRPEPLNETYLGSGGAVQFCSVRRTRLMLTGMSRDGGSSSRGQRPLAIAACVRRNGRDLAAVSSGGRTARLAS